MFKHKTNKDELDNLKIAILENTHEFDWSKHFDKFQLKLRELILRQVDKESGVPEKEKRVWGSQGEEKDKLFSTFLSLSHIIF